MSIENPEKLTEEEVKEDIERLIKPMGGKILVCEKPFGGFSVGDVIKTKKEKGTFKVKLFDSEKEKLVKGENWITVDSGEDFEDFSNSFILRKKEENPEPVLNKEIEISKEVEEVLDAEQLNNLAESIKKDKDSFEENGFNTNAMQGNIDIALENIKNKKETNKDLRGVLAKAIKLARELQEETEKIKKEDVINESIKEKEGDLATREQLLKSKEDIGRAIKRVEELEKERIRLKDVQKEYDSDEAIEIFERQIKEYTSEISKLKGEIIKSVARMDREKKEDKIEKADQKISSKEINKILREFKDSSIELQIKGGGADRFVITDFPDREYVVLKNINNEEDIRTISRNVLYELNPEEAELRRAVRGEIKEAKDIAEERAIKNEMVDSITKAQREAEAVKKFIEEKAEKIEKEPEITEPETGVETEEKEPKTTREVLERLGLLEELKMFENIFINREKDLAVIESYINDKINNGEEITQEDKEKRKEATEEVARARINVTTAKGVALSLKVPENKEDEDKTLNEEIKMTNLLLKQYEILGKIRGEEEEKSEKLNPEKQGVVNKLSSAVVNWGIDKMPKFLTHKKEVSSNQQSEKPKKEGRWKSLFNYIDQKLHRNSAEEEKEFKDDVAMEFLKILKEDNKQLENELSTNKNLKDGELTKIVSSDDIKKIAKKLSEKYEEGTGKLEKRIRDVGFAQGDLEETMKSGEDEGDLDADKDNVNIMGDSLSTEKAEPIEIIKEASKTEEIEMTKEMKSVVKKELKTILRTASEIYLIPIENMLDTYSDKKCGDFRNDVPLFKKDLDNFLERLKINPDEVKNIKLKEFKEIYDKIKEEEK